MTSGGETGANDDNGGRTPLTGEDYIPRAMRAYAEWLWIDSKFSASTA